MNFMMKSSIEGKSLMVMWLHDSKWWSWDRCTFWFRATNQSARKSICGWKSWIWLAAMNHVKYSNIRLQIFELALSNPNQGSLDICQTQIELYKVKYLICSSLDKTAMKEYMLNYAKQEEYAVICGKENEGIIRRWKCIHEGKYNNWRNLSVEKTDKEQRQRKLNAGMIFKCVV